MYTGKDGALYERCDLCGMKTEVDSREDATGWGINHTDMFHRTIFGNDFPCCDPCQTHQIRECTICLDHHRHPHTATVEP